MFPENIKHNFPIFTNHPDMVYLDSAATTQKPLTVINRESEYYTQYCANIARGLYALSETATLEYERTRTMVAEFINAHTEEIIFTRGTTESINLLSYSLESQIQEGDEILVSIAEHHSNFLPWQALAQRKKAVLKILPLTHDGQLDTTLLPSLITPKTKILAFAYISNVLGVINPAQNIISQAKQLQPDIITVIDAAQAAAHIPLDVQKLDCDFLAFSGHKMFGPTGVGVLYGKTRHLQSMSPFHYGGEMVLEARVNTSIFKEAPHKFEAGTPHISGVIALQEAIHFIQNLGFDTIYEHEQELLSYTIKTLRETFGDAIRIFGTQTITKKSGVIAFSLQDIHPHDIAGLLAEKNICIRSGQHCTAPLHDALQLPATARISVSVYTTKKDIALCIAELANIQNRL